MMLRVDLLRASCHVLSGDQVASFQCDGYDSAVLFES